MLPAAANPLSGSHSPKGQTSLTLGQWLGATSACSKKEKGSPPKRQEGGGGMDCIIRLPKMILHIIDTISVENVS